MEIERPRRRECTEKQKMKAAPIKQTTARREKSASVERNVVTDRPRRSTSADVTTLALERKAHSLAKQRIQMELEERRIAEQAEKKKGRCRKEDLYLNIVYLVYLVCSTDIVHCMAKKK